jgi:hypothetical protein
VFFRTPPTFGSRACSRLADASTSSAEPVSTVSTVSTAGPAGASTGSSLHTDGGEDGPVAPDPGPIPMAQDQDRSSGGGVGPYLPYVVLVALLVGAGFVMHHTYTMNPLKMRGPSDVVGCIRSAFSVFRVASS